MARVIELGPSVTAFWSPQDYYNISQSWRTDRGFLINTNVCLDLYELANIPEVKALVGALTKELLDLDEETWPNRAAYIRCALAPFEEEE